MIRFSFATAAVTAALLASNASAQQGLLLSEFVVTPTAGEMVEIFNPTGQTIDLTDVYLTDATFQGGSTFYYQIVEGGGGGGGFGDFHARFPAGATIGPGQYQTVALNGNTDFFATYGVQPTYEIAEDDGLMPDVPDMLEATPGSINGIGNGGLTNGDEIVILYTWGGMSDLVTDLDYVGYGGNNEQVDKTGIVIDGPDADAIGSAYAADTAIADQADAPAPAFGESTQRRYFGEGNEVNAGGNGLNGHDETSENVEFTWVTSAPTPNARLVGSLTMEIIPGIAGVENSLFAQGATPDEVVYLFISLDIGMAGVPRTPDQSFGIDILSPGAQLIARPANALGLLSLVGTPPAIPVDVYVQAVVGPAGVDAEVAQVAVIAGV